MSFTWLNITDVLLMSVVWGGEEERRVTKKTGGEENNRKLSGMEGARWKPPLKIKAPAS